MSQWFSQGFECPECNHYWDQVVLRAEKHIPLACEKCGQPAKPVLGMPTPLRKSFHDGVQRKGFRELSEAANLESKMFDLPADKRTEAQGEIDKLRSTKK